MKKILLLTWVALLSLNLIYAQTEDDSVILSLNGIYVDEILDDGDEGLGTTIELSLIVGESGGLLQTVGLEIGYITSELNEEFIYEFGIIEVDSDTTLVPLFANFAVQGEFSDANFIWKAGMGLGGIFVDADVDVDFTISGEAFDSESFSDDDFILGAQFFGSVGYKLTENSNISAGVRYMFAEDARLFGVEDEVLNSVAFDLGLSVAF